MTTWFDEERGALVAYMRLPLEVHEAVTPNEDGTCTVIINDRISEDAARRAYAHALRHIAENDFDACDVQAVERRAEREGEKTA